MRVLAAPDKFRGTLSAPDAAAAVAAAADSVGWDCDVCPLADGGEGTLDVFGGPNRTTTVRDPLGEPVDAPWRLDGRTAIIEMSRASGLALVGDDNDPIAASTHGTGQLIKVALELGATRVIVGLGGSATTDGGLGALTALYPHGRLRGVELLVACDVRTRFLDAAQVFAPQKGATAAQVRLLANRLARLADVYLEDHGVDVRELRGAGAAGGLAGGLAAVGATLLDGFDLVAELVDLDQRIEAADVVITGEGFVDAASFEGKVVGGVATMAAGLGVPTVAIVGEVVDGADAIADLGDFEVVSLVERFGRDRALGDAGACVRSVAAEVLAARS